MSYSTPDVVLVGFTVDVTFLQEFDVHIFSTLFLKRGLYCLSLHCVEGFLVVDALPVAVQFFMSRNAASTSHDVISGTCFGLLCNTVLCSLLYNSV